MKIKIIYIIILIIISNNILAQNIAITFDDGFNPRTQSQSAEWNQLLLKTLSEKQVKTTYYIAGHLINTPKGLELVSNWGEQGHSIANHTYSHMNLSSNKVSLQDYLIDIEKNHQLFKDLKGWVNRFRFPYLKEGDSISKRDGVRKWMQQNNYSTGAVSIDTSDWYYNSRYLSWKKNHQNQSTETIKKAYLDHLWDRAQYYDSLSNKILNRSSKHVMLLHANAINAAFLGDIIDKFRSNGWVFISPETAYEDPLYKTQPEILPAGESLLWSLAKQQNFNGLRYPAEDSIYEKTIIDKLNL
jgi:peptidoglycan/xylan/chitin deacetylase (PgdA/CDA1 family)